jgi:cysteine desulfurase
MFIDLDANATLTPSSAVKRRLFLEEGIFGNPSAIHQSGQRTRALVERTRRSIRDFMNLSSAHQIIFTSGATEANNIAIHNGKGLGGTLVASSIEHPCILEPLLKIRRSGERKVVLIKPSSSGLIDKESVIAALDAECSFVSIMLANNETGVINDIADISRAIRAHFPKVVIHTDASQVLGKVEIDFSTIDADMITISGHKFGALSGVGALAVRPGLSLSPLIMGGSQEGKLRGGTENVTGILSMGLAVEELQKFGSERILRAAELRDRFESEILSLLGDVSIQGKNSPRLANTSNVSIAGVRADDLVVALDLEGILISTGAACSSGKIDPSHVLLAMGLSEEQARSTIRISFRGDESPEVLYRLADTLPRIVNTMRKSTIRGVEINGNAYG